MIAAAINVVPAQDVFAIIGHEADRVRESVAHTGVSFVLQKEQRGTGHALMTAREALKPYDVVIVLSGDAPLITSSTIEKLRDCLLNLEPCIELPEELMRRAALPIERMLAVR